MLAGLATNCDIEKHSMFYRKNYMYPDMAKNFQTTQGPIAFCMRGHLDLDVDGRGATERYRLDALAPGETEDNITRTEDGYVAHVGITRIHMEEDAGKMVHLGGGEGRIAGATQSLVDYNRAGTPLDRAGDRARSAHARGGAPVHAEAAPDLPGLRHLRLLYGGRAPCAATATCRCAAAAPPRSARRPS